MPFITTIKDQHHSVAITPQLQDKPMTATIDQTSHPIDWQAIAALTSGEGGRYSLLLAGKSYDVFARLIAQPDEKTGLTYEIQLEGQYFLVEVEDERTRLLEGVARAGVQNSAANVRAPMPGLVINTLVVPGDVVTAGQTVVVLEAMKMENDLPSPIAGTVKTLKVNTGQTVDQGQLLVVIDSQPIA